jgi:ATP-dependent Clp protease ATP-binding subunit ClpA
MATNHYHYSQHARRTLSRARMLAREHSHPYVDSTHVLLGILHEEGSIGCNILHDLQMDVRHTERAFQQCHGGSLSNSASKGNAASLPLTAALQEALTLAGNESRWLGQHYVGTEHLLLGLARSNEEPLLVLLHSLDISPEQIRRRVRRLLQEGITEISIEQAKRVARLSELSRRVLNGAEQIAEQMGHREVGLAHLVLVLAHERRSICARLLREAHLDDKSLEADLVKPRPATGGMLDDVIDRAVDRAESFGSHYTGTDHLLLTIAADPRGSRLLRKYGADSHYLVETLRKYLTG